MSEVKGAMDSGRRRKVLQLLVVMIVAVTPLLMGIRRIPSGCGSGGGRLLTAAAGDVETGNLADSNATRTTSALELGDALQPFDTVRWRGDANTYVDVFDTPLLQALPDGTVIDGAEFGNFVRFTYPGSFASSFVASFDVADEAASLGVPFQGAVSLRMYDRGECSGDSSWSDLAAGIVEGLDPALVAAIENADSSVSVIPHGQWTLNPILRDEIRPDTNRDAFRLVRFYAVRGSIVGMKFLEIRITAGFQARDDQLQMRRIEEVLTDLRTSISDTRTFNDSTTERDISRAVRMQLPVMFNAMVHHGLGTVWTLPRRACDPTMPAAADAACLGVLGPTLTTLFSLPAGAIQPHNVRCIDPRLGRPGCGIVPNIKRVHSRPEGIEVVLSETDDDPITGTDPDPLLPILQFATDVSGAPCARPEGDTVDAPPTGGHFDAVFELDPPPGDVTDAV
jgi:hypothetical protein